ncbi:conserved Plasmodium protein, unknown function [Plasmodium berghei]|uniref:HSP20-like chaperone, putative n=2 Tax=Plasmodium berghei TaxID=5821 RepID=A0A509APN2_PLABA|nr:HSP20-like chaperone, putative [Plasmodium berghei ANKA]CXI90662.1 conserved Plasmodium protein, unknown function [Plasmodium berghei]SCL96293.1 conserved Plasmodium protein, unknown function [Plasmodium berghei]SCM16399.1 conserved Plasmodium protein, unknown function [Plasmodium berghei]SCM18193.1 conserved Plasmodium protein, unknown function [Plasmodium berghei]SCN27621.1 conserved Plasmodium protein, unknown function [Plasmodium berghei]|eukprot:XP_034423276.1 HSP20-like chaperone, putative [Plasmodium berghei ANKA]
MHGVINYSKFDNIEVSSSDDEVKKRIPQITTLNSKDKVVLGPDGLTILKEFTTSESIEKCGEKKQTCYNQIDNSTQNEKEKFFKNMILNGAVIPYKYIWSQSLYDINSYIVLPLNCKAKSLIIQIFEDKLIVKKEKNMNTTMIENVDDNNNNAYETLINKEFSFKINTNDDTQLWEIKTIEINWKKIFNLCNKINNQNMNFDFGQNVKDTKETFLYISLKKNSEIKSSYVWWSCLFKGDEKIDTFKLPSRIILNKNINNNNNNSFKKVWEEAHEIFKKNISKKKLPYCID